MLYVTVTDRICAVMIVTVTVHVYMLNVHHSKHHLVN